MHSSSELRLGTENAFRIFFNSRERICVCLSGIGPETLELFQMIEIESLMWQKYYMKI